MEVATLKAAKRWFVPAAMLLCLLLLSSCSKNADETANNLNKSGQVQPANANGSVAATDSIPSLKTRSTPDAALKKSGTSASAPAPLVIPAGTPITVRLQQSLSSAHSAPGEHFEAVLDEPIVVDEQTIAPTGSVVSGHVVSARRSGRLRHPGELALTLDSVTVGDHHLPIQTSNVVAYGGSHKKRNLAWIGGSTGGGALIGALAAGGKGALIGSGIGAAAGTTTAFITGKKDVGFAAERRLRFRLNHEVSVAG
jgi:hypothetical protein